MYNLYGFKGLGTYKPPLVYQPIMNSLGCHIRESVHVLTVYDWNCYLDFADKHFGKHQ